MFCEKSIELVRELHRMSDGQLPAFNVSYSVFELERFQNSIFEENSARILYLCRNNADNITSAKLLRKSYFLGRHTPAGSAGNGSSFRTEPN